jgi:predicted NBD/HSP70 family sugar kinase
MGHIIQAANKMRKLDLRTSRAATNETARDINRRIVLNVIRSHQPISRADVARRSGLQRSTVSNIVEQLIEAQWVEEGAAARAPRGRRPTALRLNDNRGIVGIDIRPLNTTVAVADVNARFVSIDTVPTAAEARTGLKQIAACAKSAMQAHRGLAWEGVGVSLPGRWDEEAGRLAFAPNLDWKNVDVRTPLARACGLETALENAANACALAEVWFGGRHDDLVAVTVSEGIGTGVFVNGQLVRGVRGMAGEFGHVSFDPAGPRCRCGGRGCWEVFGSNTAALRYFAEEGGEGSPAFGELLHRACAGDPVACRALDRMAEWLGRGAALLCAGLAPGTLVFVGEITRAWSRVGPIIEQHIAGLPWRTEVAAAGDGAMTRLRGAVALVLQKHFGVPNFL